MNEVVAELTRRAGHRSKVTQWFREHPGEWCDTRTLEKLGGRNAWRTRVSEARAIFCDELGVPFPVRADTFDPIENRHYPVRPVVACDDAGQPAALLLSGTIISEYRYINHVPLGPSADVYRETRRLF